MGSDWHLDATLLGAWREGDDHAGEQLYNRHADAVARFFENKVREGAEDLTQATFVRMIESRERIREGVVFRAFVLGIARNVLREHLRKRAPGREVDPEVESMADLEPGPVTIAGRKAEHRLLLEALRRLPVDDQILIELSYWEQLRSEDIGAIMGLPGSTARTNLSRVRKKLAAVMAAIEVSPDVLASTVEGLEGWAAQLREQLGGSSNDAPPES